MMSISGESSNQNMESSISNKVQSIVEKEDILTSGITGSVAVFEDQIPWVGLGLQTDDILTNNSVVFDKYKSTDMGSIVLENYEKIILVGNQPQQYINSVMANQSYFESYVSNGGILEIHGASTNGQYSYFPGKIDWIQSENDGVVISNITHPIFNDPGIISQAELNNWGPSSHGYFSNLPGNEDIIALNSLELPILMEFQFGSGYITISALDVEYGFTKKLSSLLENMVLHTKVVGDTTPPIIIGPTNIEFVQGTITHTLSWVGFDNNPDIYTLELNGAELQSGTWSSGDNITYNIDWLDIGTYIFVIRLFDDYGNQEKDDVIVSVIDGDTPTISNLQNTSYEFGTTNNKLIWIMNDTSPANYTIYLDGVLKIHQSWLSNTSTDFNIDDLSLGIHNFTLQVTDQESNVAREIIFIEVRDTTVPSVVGPNNKEIKSGLENVTLTWLIDDLLPSKFMLLRNATLLLNGSWSSNDNISINSGVLTSGIYEYLLIINDTSGNTINNSVFVNVTDDIRLSSPGDIFFMEGDTGNIITWFVNDSRPAFIEIWENGIIKLNNTWTISNRIQIEVDGLKAGNHNITLSIHDTFGNSASDSVTVRVFFDFSSLSDQNITSSNQPSIFGTIDNNTLAGAGIIIGIVGGAYIIVRRR